MIKILVSVVAAYTVRDAETNEISLFKIFEGLLAEGFPVLLPAVSFFTLWEKGKEEGNEHDTVLKIEIGEKTLISKNLKLDFQGKSRARQICNLKGLILPEPGLLRFSLAINGKATAEYVVDVGVREVVSVKPEGKDNSHLLMEKRAQKNGAGDNPQEVREVK